VRAEALCRALAAALQALHVERSALRGLFAPALRASEPGLLQASVELALPLRFFEPPQLAPFADRSLTHSVRSFAHTGLPSVAECCALAGVGESACLLAPRIVVDGVTCALARPLGVP
jgi:cobalt-precorrin 5A hydrolase